MTFGSRNRLKLWWDQFFWHKIKIIACKYYGIPMGVRSIVSYTNIQQRSIWRRNDHHSIQENSPKSSAESVAREAKVLGSPGERGQGLFLP